MSSAIIKTGSGAFEPDRQAKKRLLYIVHNHPSVMPGGAQIYALELYEAMSPSDEFEPLPSMVYPGRFDEVSFPTLIPFTTPFAKFNRRLTFPGCQPGRKHPRNQKMIELSTKLKE